MHFTYKTKGTCSQLINFDVEDGKIHNVEFLGGCNGNLKGIASLVEGQKIEDVIPRVEGIRCGMKPTSCPDQLAQALKEAQAQLGALKKKFGGVFEMRCLHFYNFRLKSISM